MSATAGVHMGLWCHALWWCLHTLRRLHTLRCLHALWLAKMLRLLCRPAKMLRLLCRPIKILWLLRRTVIMLWLLRRAIVHAWLLRRAAKGLLCRTIIYMWLCTCRLISALLLRTVDLWPCILYRLMLCTLCGIITGSLHWCIIALLHSRVRTRCLAVHRAHLATLHSSSESARFVTGLYSMRRTNSMWRPDNIGRPCGISCCLVHCGAVKI